MELPDVQEDRETKEEMGKEEEKGEGQKQKKQHRIEEGGEEMEADEGGDEDGTSVEKIQGSHWTVTQCFSAQNMRSLLTE